MNRACLTKNRNLHEQNQHASSPAEAGQVIRPIKNNFVRMKKSLLIALLFVLTVSFTFSKDYKVTSPDGKISVNVNVGIGI